jgi:hypothetical protein
VRHRPWGVALPPPRQSRPGCVHEPGMRLRNLCAHLCTGHGAAPTTAVAGAAIWHPIDVPFEQAAAVGTVGGRANPLARLSRGEVPAVVLRQALPPADCQGLVSRFAERGLLPSGFAPFVQQDVSRELAVAADEHGPALSKWVGVGGMDDMSAASAERMDIGCALGNLGGDPGAFFADAERWQTVYKTLFVGLPTQPIELMYSALAALAGGRKHVRTAHEARGTYCPAIYRSHMPNYGYAPHIDSVRSREKRTEYAVYRFDTQLGGILLVQAPKRVALAGEGRTPGYTPPSSDYHDTIMYQAPCTRPDVASFLEAQEQNMIGGGMLSTDAFRAFAKQVGLPAAPIDLVPGDMYFFKSDSLHEVPGFSGSLARIVQATFIGYSEGDDEIMVWS